MGPKEHQSLHKEEVVEDEQIKNLTFTQGAAVRFTCVTRSQILFLDLDDLTISVFSHSLVKFRHQNYLVRFRKILWFGCRSTVV